MTWTCRSSGHRTGLCGREARRQEEHVGRRLPLSPRHREVWGSSPRKCTLPLKISSLNSKMSINRCRFPQRCRHHLCLSNHLPAPYSLVFRTTEGSFCFTGCCLWATASQTWLRKRGTRQKSSRQNASCACADIWWQDHALDFKLLQSIQKSLADANRERVRYIFRSLGSVQYLWNYY